MRACPIWLDRRGGLITAHLGGASRTYSALTGVPASHDPPPAAVACRVRRSPPNTDAAGPMPAKDARRFAEIGLGAGGIASPAVGRTVPPQPPPHAATGRRERVLLLGADAWLPCPRAEQPNLNPSDATPIPTEYKGASQRPRSGTLKRRRPRASHARQPGVSNGERTPPVSTASRATRGRR